MLQGYISVLQNYRGEHQVLNLKYEAVTHEINPLRLFKQTGHLIRDVSGMERILVHTVQQIRLVVPYQHSRVTMIARSKMRALKLS